MKDCLKRTKLEGIMNQFLLKFLSKGDLSYLNFCKFPGYEGVVEPERAKKCELENCEHYKKYSFRRVE